ncbi:MAG: cysteine desulfurase family protein [Clostridiaceae bacterium]|nr:cysteine desulfurase family protein [Clostridiaceae bacterium]
MTYYLDNAATTAVLPCARQAALEAMDRFGNPGSLHALGREARVLLDASRETVAAALSCAPDCVYFTSGGSESINTALRGAAFKNKHLGKHIVSTAVEHDATLNTLKALADEGFSVTLVPPERDGRIDVSRLQAALRPDTILVSLMAVCNETGALLPVLSAAELRNGLCPQALLHVDAVQGFCKIPLNLSGVDLLSISAHKLGALKGSGVLYVRKGLHLRPMITGGGQENGLRSGTEAMPQIAAFAAAAGERTAEFTENTVRMKALKERLLCGLRALPGCEINMPEETAPHIVNFSMCRGRSEVWLRALSDMGLYLSGGSACARGKRSHVLAAMGLPKQNIDAALRASFCPETPEEAVDALLLALPQVGRLF